VTPRKLDLSRICVAPSALLSHLPFKNDRAFSSHGRLSTARIVDAPFIARSFSDYLEQVISAAPCPAYLCSFQALLTYMVSVDSVQIIDASKSLLGFIWFSQK